MRKVHQPLLMLALVAATSSSVFADGSFSRTARIGWHVRQVPRFMVSGVLRKNGTTDVIKPIQAIVVADDGETAVRAFAKSAERDYPDFALIATLKSPIPVAGTCENSI